MEKTYDALIERLKKFYEEKMLRVTIERQAPKLG